MAFLLQKGGLCRENDRFAKILLCHKCNYILFQKLGNAVLEVNEDEYIPRLRPTILFPEMLLRNSMLHH